MYVPPPFEVTDRAWVLELIERNPFGLLITRDADFPRVSDLPLIAQAREDGIWLVGHVARNNPHAQSIAAQAAATLVIRGPHAYVSASWYEQPYATVPTWNYEVAQLCGRLRPFDAWRAVELLSARLEGGKAEPWDPARLDPAYRDTQLRAIVGFEMHAEAIYGKAKLSQNRTEADQARVIANLLASPDQVERECGQEMSILRDRRRRNGD